MKKKEELVECRNCYGKGQVTRVQSYGAFNGFVNETCYICRGKGKVKKW